MKAVVYSTRNFEKELLAKANLKKHDITLISNPLNIETVAYAEGKNAVIVFNNDDLSEPVINKLAEYGIKYISTRSENVDHIDRIAAGKFNMKIANVPFAAASVAEHVITLTLALNRQIIQSVEKTASLNFNLEGLQSFTLSGKTVGLIGYNPTAKITAKLFKGFGSKVIVHDPSNSGTCHDYPTLSLKELLSQSDIISLHLPLNNENKHIINRENLAFIKKGAMLINTSRGGLLDNAAVLEALKSGQLGYLGADIYENEFGIIDTLENKKDRNPLLTSLIELKNVILTPHQASFTKEALQEIATQTIKNLDNWQAGKCVGKACACPNDCAIKS